MLSSSWYLQGLAAVVMVDTPGGGEAAAGPALKPSKHRKFHDLDREIMSAKTSRWHQQDIMNGISTSQYFSCKDPEKLAEFIHGDIISSSSFLSPFGRRKIVYCDYTASGRALQSIEAYIQVAYKNIEDEICIREQNYSKLYPSRLEQESDQCRI